MTIDSWILIEEEVDDLYMTSCACRVYVHFLRLALNKKSFSRNMRLIGTHCFPKLDRDYARKKALIAIRELQELKLIDIQKLPNGANFYSILSRRKA